MADREDSRDNVSQSLDAILSSLEETLLDTLQSPREYLIAGDVAKHHLMKIARLPFEVLLTRMQGRVVLTTGIEDATLHPDIGSEENPTPAYRLMDKRVSRSAFTGHNHSEGASMSDGHHPPIIRSLSSQDLTGSRETPSEIDMMFNRYGVTLFKNKRDAEYRTATSRTFRETKQQYDWRKAQAQFDDGVILYMLDWKDPRIDDVCSIINGKMTFKEFNLKYGKQTKVTQKKALEHIDESLWA